jgi:hypothetical protein
MDKSNMRVILYLTVLGLILPAVAAADPSLIGWWVLDDGAGEVAQDRSGNGIDGTLFGAPAWETDAEHGTVLLFDGTDDYVEIPGPYELETYTLTLWFRFDGTPGGTFDVVSLYAVSGHLHGVLLELRDNGTMRYLHRAEPMGTGGGTTEYTTDTYDDGAWYHMAAVKTADTMTLYVNGEVALTGSNSTSFEEPALVVLGTLGGTSNARWFNGALSDFRIYDRALAENEIPGTMVIDETSAKNPTPADEAIDVPRDSELTWSTGKYAVEHDVYLGTSFEDVNSATPAAAAYRGRQAETVYAPETLVLGTTYYWRIDEVNAAPDSTVFKGDVWSFQVEPVSYPIPIGAVSASASSTTEGQDPINIVNGAGLNENDEHSNLQEEMWLGADTDLTPSVTFEMAQVEKLDKVHVWNHNTQTEAILGFGIKEALIETSLDGENWAELKTVELPQATGSADETGADVALDGVVAKYVKITALSNYSVLGLPQKGLSEVRFFAVPVRARQESPATGTMGLDPLVELGWRVGREAARHELLLGTEPDALIQVANTDDPAYTASLDLDSKVYWQVNEVNDAMDPALWEGPVWEMTTLEYLTVDDMESYKSKEGSYVWETWLDGFDDDNNGALLGHGGDDMETGIVYDGSQSLPFYYGQGGAASSEASRDIERDWGQHGIVSLSLMFFGAKSNIAGELYLKVNDAEIATYPVSSDLTIPQWQAWTIDLPASALGNVTNLAIGVKGGTGLIMIDAIRLYDRPSETISGVMPNDMGLVGHWTFDEGSGTAAADSSGHNNHGEVMGDAQWVAGGKVGGALSFDGVDDIVVVSQNSGLPIYNNGTDNAYSVALWVKGGPQNDLRVFSEGSTTSNNPLFNLGTHNSASPTGQFAAYIRPDTGTTLNHPLSQSEPFDDTWHHLTWVDDNGTATLYVDGLQDAGDFNYTRGTMALDTTTIGGILRAAPSHFFFGQIDEVRVYNRILTHAEALGLAGRQDPIFKPF